MSVRRASKNPAAWQPLKLLKLLARYPHTNRQPFEKTHTVAVGDEPLLLPMKAAWLMPPVLVPELREPLELARGGHIRFLAIYLLHPEELLLKLEDRVDELLEKFGEQMVTEEYDLGRPSVVKAPAGWN